MKQQTLLNKNIIITAAADGIGLAIVEYCLNYGANVFLTDVNQKKLSILKKHPQYNKKLFITLKKLVHILLQFKNILFFFVKLFY